MYRWLSNRVARVLRPRIPWAYAARTRTRPPPITGVETRTAGFLGETERGPGAPRLLTDFDEFVRLYGDDGGDVAAAVEGFFDNGGRRCYVGRVTASTTTASATLTDADGAASIAVSAVGPGAWGTDVTVRVADAPTGRPDEFELTVEYVRSSGASGGGTGDSAVEEGYGALSVAADAPTPIETRINGTSALVDIDRVANGSGRPTNGATALSGPETDPTATVSDYEGTTVSGERRGLAAFEELGEVSLVCAPATAAVPGVASAVESHCTAMGDRFAVLDAPRDVDDVGSLSPPVNSPNAAVYYPWLVVDGAESTDTVPPCGHVAGVYARTDAERGVHKAPANEALSGVVGVQRDVTATEQDLLNPRGVNCIREFPGRGVRVWGARTTSNDPEWRYVNVRRLRLYLEESIAEGLDWVAFEPNGERTWASVRATVENFLTDEWRRGALRGTKPEESFFVSCDRSVMTRADVEDGRLVVRVGFAPLRPAEFAVFEVVRGTGT